MDPQGDKERIDARVAKVAGAQFGVITYVQLLAVGVSPTATRNRVRAGRLHRIHRGVYAVGHAALSNEGRWMAAVLACGEGAVLSHRSAAEHWKMLDPVQGPVHVTVPGTVSHRRGGVTAHRSVTLSPRQIVCRSGIRLTTPGRALADLNRTAPRREFERALRQAELLGLVVGEVRSEGTRSEFESAFLALCRRHRLPRPLVNVRVGPYEVDFLWPEAKLTIETDGWQAHRGRIAFQTDRERDLHLKLQGYEVVRLSYVQVTRRGAEVAAAVRRLLVRRRAA